MDVNEVGDIIEGGGPDGGAPEKLGEGADPGGNVKGDASIVCATGPTAGGGGPRVDGVKVEMGGGGPIDMFMLEFVFVRLKLVVGVLLIMGGGGNALVDGEARLVMGDEFICGTKPGGTKVEAVVENVETEGGL